MELRVATFNVRCGVADDGANSWQYRRDSARSLISSIDADIIGLQEAYDYQNRDLLEALPAYGLIGVGREDGANEGEFCSILHRSFQILTGETFWLSETPERVASMSWETACTRICTYAVLQGKDGQRLVFANVHLDHESQKARERGVRLMLERLPQDLPTIVAGDFNAGEDNPAILEMQRSGFRDTYREIYPEGKAGTYHGFQEAPCPDKIDYIWVSRHWEVRGAQIHRDLPFGRYPSDHYALSADLVL